MNDDVLLCISMCFYNNNNFLSSSNNNKIKNYYNRATYYYSKNEFSFLIIYGNMIMEQLLTAHGSSLVYYERYVIILRQYSVLSVCSSAVVVYSS